MKLERNILSALLFTVLSFFFVQQDYAQDSWTQGKKGIYSVGVGGTQVIDVGGGGFDGINNMGLSVNVSGEYKVWKFVGLGFETGANVLFPYYRGGAYGYLGYPLGYGYGYGYPISDYIGIPVVLKANFHILDAVGGISIADKLDCYVGLNVGGGPLFGLDGGWDIAGFVVAGPQIGIRYWFTKKVAIFGEFGYGATFANAGVSF
jgi:hypothetical protein